MWFAVVAFVLSLIALAAAGVALWAVYVIIGKD